MSQILYGCTSAYCTTPTCLSCNKRLNARPFRAPTRLTAAALAHFLASQDYPHRGLCPHQPKVAPDSLDIEGAVGVEVRHDASPSGRARRAVPVIDPRHQLSRRMSATMPQANGGQSQLARVLDAVHERHQTRKDPKALVQNVFDTVSVIYSYSKQIPGPASLFALLRSPEPPDLSTLDASQSPSIIDSANETNEELATHTNGHVARSAVNGSHAPADPDPPPSQPLQRDSHRPNSLSITSEVLSNGQRVHKIRHHLPQSTDSPQSSPPKSHEPSILDGSADLQPSSPKMRNKPPTLNLPQNKKSNPVPRPNIASDNNAGHVSSKRGPVLPVVSHLTCDIMDQLKEDVYHHRNEQPPDFNIVVDFESNRRFRPSKPFVNRSMFYTLSDPETLLRSFRDKPNEAYKDSPLPHLDSTALSRSFCDWNRRNGALIFDSLWLAVEALFRPPPELDVQKSPRLKPSRKNAPANASPAQPCGNGTCTSSGRYLEDEEAAHIVMICIHALTSLVPIGWPHTWIQLRKFRSWGIILPNAPPHTDFSSGFIDPWLSIIDELEYEPATRLADRLLRGIGARLCFEQILSSLGHRERHPHGGAYPEKNSGLVDILIKHLVKVEQEALASKEKRKSTLNTKDDPGWTVTATFMEWMRTVIIKKWDGKAEVNRWSNIGTAIMLFSQLHVNCDLLNLRPTMFSMPYINERIDPVTEATEYINREYQPNTFHVFQYPCLFPADYLVGYFRTINFTSMFKQYERTERASQLQRAMENYLKEPYWYVIRTRLKVTLSDYFVLDVSRNNALKDTLDQLWGQETRALLKPLKVKMGMQEGEVGLDQGGVTYEFFRVVLHEAFKPDTGMFTIDPQTRMTWFQPASLEPEWKFEMLGVLFSLALYNGITLPVTFPLAFYHALLPISPSYDYSTNSTDYIRDGWPTLAKSFDELLAWADDDVADIFMRDYTFSFSAFGQNMDWRHPAAPTPPDPPLVSNANRRQFVKDYIHWLTVRSIAPQLTAFRKGFAACLSPQSLSLFSPPSLRALAEGLQYIDAHALRAAARYEDGYHAEHRTIRAFWQVVEGWDQKDRRRLLEFVTASERVPVTGLESMNFVIGRAGGDTELLPTSSTCFGKLMLPEYEGGVERVAEKLGVAVRCGRGFGVV
ncbi:hypothetical protein BS50DRAFT_482755 [Corynespora cassiicola Philippines]|uniref:HECT-type E3 ubiquitin transferase n=1 Tax=Corynespora cassiicola Philippines TaxID=1448308 RepID=A0A2T2P7G5_CORCC|nr:hypothetical protein BS50DRAFT_482755 [Corynespora cassiicola Philippines]